MDASCEVSLERVSGLQQLLEPDARPLAVGDPLPPLWHWVALPRWADSGLTGPDGHPRRDPALGPTGVRRMFAGGEVEYTGGPLLIGEAVTVRTSLGQVQAKSGRSGDFVLATFQVEVRDSAGTVRVSERQDVVYSDPRPSALTAPSGALPIVGRALLPVEGAYELRTDPTVLLRFSSLTANGHRIHYDLGYAVEVEKLPGLLVHGPLLNIALTRAACATAGRHDVVRVQHRNLNPLFCGQSARLDAVADESGATAQAIGPGDEATAVKGRVALMFSAEKEGSR